MAADGYLHGLLADGARAFRYRPGVARLLGRPPDGLSLRFLASPYAPSFPYLRPPARGDHTATLAAVRGESYAPTVHMEAEAPLWSYAAAATEGHRPPPHAAVEQPRAAPRTEPEPIPSNSAQVQGPPNTAEVPLASAVAAPSVIPPVVPVTLVQIPVQEAPGPATAVPPAAPASAATSMPTPPPLAMTAPIENGVQAPNPPPPIVGRAGRVESVDQSTVVATIPQSRTAPATNPPTTARDDAAIAAAVIPPSRPAAAYRTLPPRPSTTSAGTPPRDVSRAPAARLGTRVDTDVSASAVDSEWWDVTTAEVVDAAPIAAATPPYPMVSEPIYVVDDMNPVVVPAFWARRHLNRLRPRLLR